MIRFDVENVEMPLLDFDLIRSWIQAVADAHGCNARRLSYLFCDDSYILEANNRFLGHDYYTDIITFDYSRAGKLNGDMIISLDTVSSNALQLGVERNRELLRVIIHGVLHLCGIDDKGPGEREIMEQNEDEALKIYDHLLRDNQISKS